MARSVSPFQPSSRSPAAEKLPEPGELIRGYEFDGLIGTGFTSIVYRAHHRELGRVVAIKVLRPELVEVREVGIAIAEARPRSIGELVKVQGLGPTKADRYGEHLLAIIAAEADRTRSSS